jgi:hypothetical protein
MAAFVVDKPTLGSFHCQRFGFILPILICVRNHLSLMTGTTGLF